MIILDLCQHSFLPGPLPHEVHCPLQVKFQASYCLYSLTWEGNILFLARQGGIFRKKGEGGRTDVGKLPGPIQDGVYPNRVAHPRGQRYRTELMGPELPSARTWSK